MGFPLRSFSGSPGAGIWSRGETSCSKPAEVVVIEMGYNDCYPGCEAITEEDVVSRMPQTSWYRNLKNAAATVKFVVFVYQPSYRKTVEPRKAHRLQHWVKGETVEGARWTDVAIRFVEEELGIPALGFRASAKELFGEMVHMDKSGVAWQTRSKGASYKESG